MTIERLAQTISVTGLAVLMIAGNARAGNITYSTDGVETGFNGGSLNLTLSDTSGATATLIYHDDVNVLEDAPTNLNYGYFTLSCAGCTSNAGGAGTDAVFGAFTFDIEIIDQTDGDAEGLFAGTSTGGTAYSDSSTITVDWSAPLQIGPGTFGDGVTGNFGSTIFLINATTAIVAPNSGPPQNGESTVQGSVTNSPEPATLPLLGCGLIAIGFLGRKKILRAR